MINMINVNKIILILLYGSADLRSDSSCVIKSMNCCQSELLGHGFPSPSQLLYITNILLRRQRHTPRTSSTETEWRPKSTISHFVNFNGGQWHFILGILSFPLLFPLNRWYLILCRIHIFIFLSMLSTYLFLSSIVSLLCSITFQPNLIITILNCNYYVPDGYMTKLLKPTQSGDVERWLLYMLCRRPWAAEKER